MTGVIHGAENVDHFTEPGRYNLRGLVLFNHLLFHFFKAKMGILSILILFVVTFLDCDVFTYGSGCTSNCLCASH
jgi:hypothetical protein